MLNVHKLFELSELPGTIDSALPQYFWDNVNQQLNGINPCELFVWWYAPKGTPHYYLSGCPLSIAAMYSTAVSNGKLLQYLLENAGDYEYQNLALIRDLAMSVSNTIAFAIHGLDDCTNKLAHKTAVELDPKNPNYES